MKLPVYDSVNKGRLLGYLEVTSPIRGYRYEVPYMVPFSTLDRYRPSGMDRVIFDIEVRQESHRKEIDWATQEITMFERKVLETSEKLETLMKIDRFWLPGEDQWKHIHRTC